jgi:hypothetical protein
MFQLPPEILVAQVTTAFAIGLQSGPIRLDFTDRRFIVTSGESPSLPPALGRYRAWKATLPLPPYCRALNVPYLQDLPQIWTEIPNEQVAAVRAHREGGLGIDKTVADLSITNIRQGLQIGAAAAAKPGLPARNPGALRLLFRVPAPAEELCAFLCQTPLVSVARAP